MGGEKICMGEPAMALPASSNTVKYKIYKNLRRAIIMQHLLPGERIAVDELAQEYGTSITPVREALQMLDQEGLVTIKPRSGYFVTRLTLKQLRDLLELRGILELASVERAAERITAEQLAGLERVHAGYTGDDEESYDRYTDENREFHYLIAEASGNEELAELLRRVHERLARYMVMRRGGRSQLHTHARILEALRRHDVGAAKQAMLEEITETRDAILERVIQEESSSWQLQS